VDAFVALWSEAEHLPRESYAFTSIFGLTYRAVIREMRSQSGLATSPVLGERRVPVARTADLNPWYSSLGSLPMDQRATLLLAYQIGCSVEEIGRITRTTPQTVHSRMSFARKRLRECLNAMNAEALRSATSIHSE